MLESAWNGKPTTARGWITGVVAWLGIAGGETLRETIEREKQLSGKDSVSITRKVADALQRPAATMGRSRNRKL